MNLLILALILAALPIINWIFEYYFSNKEGQLIYFKKHFTCYYADLILIPFNFFAAFTISLNEIYILIFLIVSFLAAIILYPYWARLHKAENIPCFFFNIKTQKTTNAGIAHFVFQVIEVPIILLFLISHISNLYRDIASAFLLLFFIFWLIGSKKIHQRIMWFDALMGIIGLILVLLSFFLPRLSKP